jgi:hypothetical protein
VIAATPILRSVIPPAVTSLTNFVEYSNSWPARFFRRIFSVGAVSQDRTQVTEKLLF